MELIIARGAEDESELETTQMENALERDLLVFTKPIKWWENADYEGRHHIAHLIFPARITFDGETIGTPVINSALKDLR